jgi:DNA-binding IclR family transcriptional regulator
MGHIGVERALILLRYIADQEDGLSIREVSRELGMSTPAVQNIIEAMKAQGFVEKNISNDRYYFGPEAIHLGFSVVAKLDIRQISRTHLEDLCKETGETVFLGVLSGDKVIYIDKVVSEQMIRIDARFGATRPLNCTAVGKALLAYQPSKDIRVLYEGGAFEKMTGNSIVELELLLSELEKIRKQGWSFDDEEFMAEVCCVAAPIRDGGGEVIASVSISAPASRVRGRENEIIELVKLHAKRISENLGYIEREH